VEDSLSLSVKSESRSILSKIDISQNRLTSENYFLSNILKGKSKKNIKSEIYSDVLRVLQPRQTLFYGRLLSGIMNKKTQAFSANHSYYDSSLSAEYFSNHQSYRVYPYFNNSLNRISIYPVMSPSKINFHIEVYEGKKVYKSEIKTLLSPSNNVLKFEIDDIVQSSGFKDVSLYKVFATVNKGKIPTRVTHQLIYGPQHSTSKLNCTIAINLANKDIFIPKTKTGLCWGQVLTSKNYNSYLGISFNDNVSEHHKVNVKFYGNKGLIKSVVRTIKPNHSAIFDNDFFSKLSGSDDFIWYIAKSERPDLSAKSFHYHSISHHASGEHSF